MGQASSQTSLGSCSVVNCHGHHCTEWSLATCTRFATTTRTDVACFVDAAVASSARARAGDNPRAEVLRNPDLAQDDWFCRKTPSGRSFWHHVSFGPPQPWQECTPADDKVCEENQDIETRKEYVVNRFVGFDEEALAEHSTNIEDYAIHESFEKDLVNSNELNKENEVQCHYASGSPNNSCNQVTELNTGSTTLSSLHDMKLRIESQNLEPTFDIHPAGACMAAAEEVRTAAEASTRPEGERSDSKADVDGPQPTQQEVVAKRSQQRQEKKPRPKPKAFAAPAGDKKLHHISIANLRAPGSSTKPAAANPRLKVEDVLVW